MKSLDHIMISASAGSGKTYQLVRRYIHLLALGVEPERIAAMTFTRKAAGEFFNRILRRLAELADGRCDPAQYFAGIEPRPARWPDFRDLTRKLLRHMHRLRLGTLDSFFATITACFPMELGLPVGSTVMAEEDARGALDEALDDLMGRVYRDGAEAEARALLEGYKLGTYGREDKSVLNSLRSWIRAAHHLWLDCPRDDAWGHARTIWPGKSGTFLFDESVSFADLAAQLHLLGEKQDWSDEGFDKWAAMASQVREFHPGVKIEKPLSDLLDKCFEAWRDLQSDGALIVWMRRKTMFAGTDARLLVDLIHALARAEFLCRCERTRGVARTISAYESGYNRLVRQKGRLSFSDVQRLLAGAQEQGGQGVFSGDDDNGDLWYRLDGRHDHWLFDEFQDTSAQQWQVVGDLVDEVLTDESGRRSFFAVGDTKQSIYMWRQAEPGLFHSVEKRYANEKSGLKKLTLAHSHRSCQQVLDAVNAAFDKTEVLEELLPGCFDGWEFAPHESAKPGLQGHAALLFHDAKSDEIEDPKKELVAELLRQIRPAERGLSCAVLVKQNKVAAEMAEHLRSATGMDVVSESRQHPATDNPVTLTLLSILKLAAHPGDRFALEHVRMTPLRTVFEIEFSSSLHRLSTAVLATVHETGFAEFVGQWTQKLRAADLDEFSRRRLSQLADIASEFDESGSRDVDAFLGFAREYGARSQGPENAVQVMTIHKSKGLEFDVVILPDLDGNGMKTLKPLDLVKKQPLFARAEWILQWPGDTLARFDGNLWSEKENLARREGFEGMCQLYVAMTRAKLGLYMITKPPPKSSGSSVNEARLLRERMATGDPRAIRIGSATIQCAAQFGDARWFEEHALAPRAEPEAPRAPEESMSEMLRRTQPLARRLTPSDEESFRVTGSILFAPGRESGRNFGSLVHALLAEIDWFENARDEHRIAALHTIWKAHALDRLHGFDEAAKQVAALLCNESTGHVFRRTKARITLWRERAFDLLHEGEWISGVMDRVVIENDANGAPSAAWLVDFKTDTVNDEAQLMEKVNGYRPQIRFYCEALQKLTGLHPGSIRASLIFTRQPREVQIESLHQ